MKTAVAYYSLGGTTRSYARAEAKARNADLIELTPKTPYNRFTAFVRGCLEAVKQKAVALDGMPLFVGYDRVVLMASGRAIPRRRSTARWNCCRPVRRSK